MRRHKQNRNQVWSTECQTRRLFNRVWTKQKFLCHEEAEKAASYLVKVLSPSPACIELYLDKSSSLIELPPTSSLIFWHILRSHFVIHQYLNLLNATEKSNVQEFGWIEVEDGCFIPDKCLSPIPRYFITKCGCKKGCSPHFQCSFADIKCTGFCVGRTICENG